MKNSILFFLLTTLYFFSACTKDSNTQSEINEFNFNSFKTEVQESSEFQTNQKAQHQFLKELGNGEFDLIPINNFLFEQNITDYRSIDPNILEQFNGGEKYLSSLISWLNTTEQLQLSFPDIGQLTKGQITILFEYNPNTNSSNQANQRQGTCLDAYNSAYYEANFYCNVYGGGNFGCEPFNTECCSSAAVDSGASAFDDCCENGGECGGVPG